MLRSRLRIALVSAVLLAPACAALVSNLPAIISATQSASLVISTIESFVHAYFALHSDPAKEALVFAAIVKAKAADALVLEVANATDSIDKNKVGAAFAELESAYEELLVVVKPFGVMTGAVAGGGLKMAAATAVGTGATLVVPVTLTLKMR